MLAAKAGESPESTLHLIKLKKRRRRTALGVLGGAGEVDERRHRTNTLIMMLKYNDFSKRVRIFLVM